MKRINLGLSILCLFAWACHKYVAEPSNPLNGLVVTINGGNPVRADNFSVVPVVLNKSADSLTDSARVYFSSSEGSFLNISSLFSNELATGYLKIGEDTGTYFLTLKLMQDSQTITQKDTSFRVLEAYPDGVAFETNRSFASTDTPMTISMALRRNVGWPTKGQTVSLRAIQISLLGIPQSVGRFEGILSNYSDSVGNLTPVTFFSDTKDIDTTRVVFVIASTINDAGFPVMDTLMIQYQ